MVLMSILSILCVFLFLFVFIYDKVVIFSYFIESANMICEIGIGFFKDLGGVIDYSNILRKCIDSSTVYMLEIFVFLFYLESLFNLGTLFWCKL